MAICSARCCGSCAGIALRLNNHAHTVANGADGAIDKAAVVFFLAAGLPVHTAWWLDQSER